MLHCIQGMLTDMLKHSLLNLKIINTLRLHLKHKFKSKILYKYLQELYPGMSTQILVAAFAQWSRGHIGLEPHHP